MDFVDFVVLFVGTIMLGFGSYGVLQCLIGRFWRAIFVALALTGAGYVLIWAAVR